MPKFIVTSDSYFQPFSYDELAKPLEQMAELHRTTQDAYDTIGTEAEALRRYIEQEPNDSNARKMYDSYMEKLSNLQNNLWANGYNAQTRRDLATARKGYASDITRLGTAIEARQKRSDEYWKTRHDHPDMIMSADPGTASLDEYLSNDRYGQDYYGYSGNQFAAEVGTDIKARAAELLSDPRIERNPELFGYLTRIRNQGVTTDEINNGMYLVRSIIGNNPENIYGIDAERLSELGLDAPTTMVAQVLLSHLQSTGAAGKVSPEEFNRLVTYGGYGLSQGVMQPDVKDFNDILAQDALERSTWKWKQDYQLSQQLQLAAAKKKAEEESLPRPDHYEYEVTGSKAKKAERQTREYEKQAKKPIVTKDNIPVTNRAEASELVYGGEKRREAFKQLGFDAGMDPARTRESKFLQGTITDEKGKEWQVRYNPRVRYNGEQGFVEVKSGRGQWGIDLQRTQLYRDTVDYLQKTKDYYKNNEPDVFKLATIDPDEQAKDYEKWDTPFSVPMTDFKLYVQDQPGNGKGRREDVYMVRKGLDPGEYSHRITSLIASSLEDRNNGKGFKKIEGRRGYKDTSEYIHEVGKDGELRAKVANPNDVFRRKDGDIVNINSIRISPELAKQNCILVETDDKKLYAINVDMLNSTSLQNYFDEYNATINAYDEDNRLHGRNIWNRSDTYDELDSLVGKIHSLFGWDNNTQTQGGSHQENPYN